MTTINGTTNNNQWTYKLEVFEDSYSIENNTSNVTVKVYLGRASSRSYVGGNWTGTVTVNGATRNVSGTIPYPTYIDGGAWYEIKSETFTSILHNDDGSKTIGVSATMSSTVFTPSSCSASGNVTLTTIPRASSISCSGGNIGSATTISISRASSSFTHTLIYSFGSLTNRTIVTKTSSTSVSWTIPTSFYAQIPTSNSGIVTLECWTYSGSTLIGKSTTTCTVNVTNSNPTFTSSQLTYLDSNSSVVAITENNQHIVRNQSNLKVTYTAATSKNSATISSYVITFNGGTQTKTAAATIDYGKVNLSSNATVSVKAIDSRGNSTTISKTIQIKDWVLPSATITAGRVNNYEDETRLKANVTISSVNSKNAIQSIQYRYKKSSESNYGSYVSMSNNVQSTLSIDKLYAWDFQIVITDKFGSTTYNFTIAKGMPIMFIDTKKLSVGINSFPTSNNIFNVDGEIRQNNIPISGGGSGITTTVAVGTTTTGAAGTQASVTNSGSNVNAVFDFVIPRGNKGDKGDTGYGVISGGTTGQVLAKKSNTNYDTEWVTINPVLTESDPVFSASAASGITSNDISNWNNKSNFSGDYNDLTNKPTIPTVPTNLSSFIDDLGSSPVHTHSQYLTSHQDISGKVDKVTGKGLSTNDFTNAYKDNVDNNTAARHTHSNKSVLDGISSTDISNWNNKSTFSGDYNDLTNKPTIPTNISAFTNDVGYITANDLIPIEIIDYNSQDVDIMTKLNSCMNYLDKKLLKKPIISIPTSKNRVLFADLVYVKYTSPYEWAFKCSRPNAYSMPASSDTNDFFPRKETIITYSISNNTLEKTEETSEFIKQIILYADEDLRIKLLQILINGSIQYPLNILYYDYNYNPTQWSYYEGNGNVNGNIRELNFNFISGLNTKTITMAFDESSGLDDYDYRNWLLYIDGVLQQ